jgi:hypothetical protein
MTTEYKDPRLAFVDSYRNYSGAPRVQLTDANGNKKFVLTLEQARMLYADLGQELSALELGDDE